MIFLICIIVIIYFEHFKFQDLSVSITAKEPDLLEELHSASEQLSAVCNPEIQNEINALVTESVTCWNKSNNSLKKLCERYQNAVQVWSNYRKNSDVVNEWVDNQLNSLHNLPPEELVKQLQVCILVLLFFSDFY